LHAVQSYRKIKSDIFSPYYKIVRQHPRLTRKEERALIRNIWKGDTASRRKLLLHLTGFFLYRTMTTVYGQVLMERGEDILQDCHLLADQRVNFYKLWFKNKDGIFVSYGFTTYLWKYVTGIIMKHIKDACRMAHYDDERLMDDFEADE
jgi:hypothetical protein